MLVEDARCSRHGEHVGVGSECVALEWVEWFACRTVLSVVVFDEGDGILAVARLIDERIARLVACAACELRPVVAGSCIAHAIAELEVECARCRHVIDFCAIDPSLDIARTVPVLSHAELRLGCCVVVGSERRAVALDHIIAETCIAELVDEIVEIGLDDLVDVLALVVEVATAVPAFASIVVLRKRQSILCCPVEGLVAIVVLDNVGAEHLIGLALVGLGRIIDPRAVNAKVVAVVDDYIGYDACATVVVGLDH